MTETQSLYDTNVANEKTLISKLGETFSQFRNLEGRMILFSYTWALRVFIAIT